jgi:hypothetical protein
MRRSQGSARPVDKAADLVRALKMVAMQQNEVGDLYHGLRGHPAKARAYKETPHPVVYAASGALLNSLDEFLNPRRAQDVVIVVQAWNAEISNVCLIVDLDQDIRVEVVEKLLGCAVAGVDHRAFVRYALILAIVEKSEDRSHAEFVGSIEDQPQTDHIV